MARDFSFFPCAQAIVEFYYISLTRSHLCIMLEYCEGGELFEFLRATGCLNEDAAVLVMRQLVSALSYLHSAGILHRDIKLENTLLESMPAAPEDLRVKVADFGYSKDTWLQSTPKTRVGTLAYMAPELVLRAAKRRHEVIAEDEAGERASSVSSERDALGTPLRTPPSTRGSSVSSEVGQPTAGTMTGGSQQTSGSGSGTQPLSQPNLDDVIAAAPGARKAYDGRAADVFSLGVLCYTMLLGSYPFEFEAAQAAAAANREDADPTEVYSELRFPAGEARPSEDACKLLERMLHPVPSERATLDEVQSSAFLRRRVAPRRLPGQAPEERPVRRHSEARPPLPQQKSQSQAEIEALIAEASQEGPYDTGAVGEADLHRVETEEWEGMIQGLSVHDAP